jgi:ribonuclease J
VGLAIQTVAGTIIHSGDFKIDFSSVDGEVTDIYRFADYGEKESFSSCQIALILKSPGLQIRSNINGQAL